MKPEGCVFKEREGQERESAPVTVRVDLAMYEGVFTLCMKSSSGGSQRRSQLEMEPVCVWVPVPNQNCLTLTLTWAQNRVVCLSDA